MRTATCCLSLLYCFVKSCGVRGECIKLVVESGKLTSFCDLPVLVVWACVYELGVVRVSHELVVVVVLGDVKMLLLV